MAFVVTTPEEFEKKMQDLHDNGIVDEEYGMILNDPETVHMAMDDLLCKVLVENGYWKGVTIFKNTYKWYA